MGEALFGYVRYEFVGQLAVVVHILAPAARVHLIDADRAVVRIGDGALGHPRLIMPFMFGVDHDGAGTRRNLMRALHRVGLHCPLVVGVENLVLVDLTVADTWHEQFPDA